MMRPAAVLFYDLPHELFAETVFHGQIRVVTAVELAQQRVRQAILEYMPHPGHVHLAAAEALREFNQRFVAQYAEYLVVGRQDHAGVSGRGFFYTCVRHWLFPFSYYDDFRLKLIYKKNYTFLADKWIIIRLKRFVKLFLNKCSIYFILQAKICFNHSIFAIK